MKTELDEKTMEMAALMEMMEMTAGELGELIDKLCDTAEEMEAREFDATPLNCLIGMLEDRLNLLESI